MAILEIDENKTVASELIKYQLNSTSYSGADIKVLINSYSPRSTAISQKETLSREINDVEKRVDFLNSEISRLETKLTTVNSGTPEYQKWQKQLNKYNEEYIDQQTVLFPLSETMKEIEEGITPTGSVIPLASLQTISISSFRSKEAVRAIGHVYPKAYVRSQRSISGTMIFTVFYKHVLEELLTTHCTEFDHGVETTTILDQIPPLDLTIVFANEYGNISRMAIYGLEFLNEGMVLSIDDLFTETTISWVARDFDPIRAVQQRKIDPNNRLMHQWTGAASASSLILESDYQREKDRSNPFFRFLSRRNPYI